MQGPSFSIITVCFNSEKTIRRTFDSILNQGYSKINYIVIDGASTDNTLDIIKEYESKFKLNNIDFYWISEPDKGLYDAMNKGIDMAKGELIGILNSDDYYENGILSLIAETYKKNPKVDIIYGLIRQLDGEIEVSVSRWNYDYIFSKDNKTNICSGAQHPTCFVQQKVYKEIGKFDLSFPTAADFDFLLRAKQHNKKFYAVDAILTNFSLNGVSNNILESVRDDQKSKILYKNGLIDEQEYKKLQKKLKYTKYKDLKIKIVQTIFGLKNAS